MTEEERTALDALPRLGCGAIAYPGQAIYSIYLGSRWEARIANVGQGTVDVKYTNKASHAAKGCLSRLRKPAEWYAAKGVDCE